MNTKIELMSQAAKLAVDCLYNMRAYGYDLEDEGYLTAENIIIDLFLKNLGLNAQIYEQISKTLSKSRGKRHEYFNHLSLMVNDILGRDLPISDLGDQEAQLRNDLQYLVCLADAARDEMEKTHEEASTIIQTAS